MRADVKGGSMYGYKIVDGRVIVDEQEAAVVINIFNGYLSGMSLRDAAVNATAW